MAEFNLITEPWIPCVDLDGNLVEYGIRDTFLKAHELREICDDSPLVTVAIHRLLLAILYRALQGPMNIRQWKEQFVKGTLVSEVSLTDYLNQWYDRFFLYDETHPFMQVAGLDLNDYKSNGEIQKNKTDGLMRLAREAPDIGGRILFDHRVGTERPYYEYKQIAKMVLTAHSFSGTGVASGGKLGDKVIAPTPCQFAPCVKGYVLWIQGENLFHTLLINLNPRSHAQSDRPAWEDDRVIDAAVQSWKKPLTFTGSVQRFAPLSRFIRVLDQQSVFFTNGLKSVNDSEDPMKVFFRSDDNKDFQALELRKDKAAWRDSHTLFALGSALHKPPAVMNHIARLFIDGTLAKTVRTKANVVGLATDKDKVLLWRHERMPVPIGILGTADLTERLGTLIGEAEAVGALLSRGLFWSATSKKTIRTEPVGRIQSIADLVLSPLLEVRFPGILRTSDGRAPEDTHNKASLDLSISLDPRPAYWARLEKHFFALLEELPNDWDTASDDWKPDDQQAATNAWREHVKDEARRALEDSVRTLGTTARAIRAVARVRTGFNDEDLRPPSPKAKEKKGGKKQ